MLSFQKLQNFHTLKPFFVVLASTGVLVARGKAPYLGLDGFHLKYRPLNYYYHQGRHSTEVAFALLTNKPRIQIFALPIFQQMQYLA